MHTKVFFELQQDEDGYPPDRWESVWAIEVEPGQYSIDNIPFFVKGLSSGDIVSANKSDQVLVFDKLLRASGNSVIRLYISDPSQVQKVRDEFRALGCASELSHISQLVAIEVPSELLFGPVADLLTEGQDAGRWDYEEGVLRHALEP